MGRKRRILPCSVMLNGEYGMKDLFLGVPIKIGRKGMEKIVEVELTSEEKTALEKSADSVREMIELLK